jgi:prenyltransferase beta subunit
MKNKKELLAYCGLYCGDCAGYSGEIADVAQNLKETLEKYKFHQTAKHLFPTELKDYDKLQQMIDFMTELNCIKTCRQKKDSEVKCGISKCCRDKGFFACYECSTFETCTSLETLSSLHGDSHIKNLSAIREKGIDNWILRSKRLWFADDV